MRMIILLDHADRFDWYTVGVVAWARVDLIVGSLSPDDGDVGGDY